MQKLPEHVKYRGNGQKFSDFLKKSNVWFSYSRHRYKLFRTQKHEIQIPIALEWSLASIISNNRLTSQSLQYPTSYYIVKFLLHERISTSANFGWISSSAFFPETSSAYTTKLSWRNSTYPTPIPWPKEIFHISRVPFYLYFRRGVFLEWERNRKEVELGHGQRIFSLYGICLTNLDIWKWRARKV